MTPKVKYIGALGHSRVLEMDLTYLPKQFILWPRSEVFRGTPKSKGKALQHFS